MYTTVSVLMQGLQIFQKLTMMTLVSTMSLTSTLTSIFFRYTCIMEKDPCRGAVYLIVLCDGPYLISVLFAVLLSLHLVTF